MTKPELLFARQRLHLPWSLRDLENVAQLLALLGHSERNRGIASYLDQRCLGLRSTWQKQEKFSPLRNITGAELHSKVESFLRHFYSAT